MSKPSSYCEQSSCPSCEHVFILSEYDGPNNYYCHFDKSERPKCMSVAMGEYQDPLMEMLRENPDLEVNEETMEESHRRYMLVDDEWESWAEPREVSSWGCCGEYVKRKES